MNSFIVTLTTVFLLLTPLKVYANEKNVNICEGLESGCSQLREQFPIATDNITNLIGCNAVFKLGKCHFFLNYHLQEEKIIYKNMEHYKTKKPNMTEDQIFSKVYDLLAKAYGTEEVRSEFKNKLKKSLDKEMVNLIRKGIVLFNAKSVLSG